MIDATGLHIGGDKLSRCGWPGDDTLYQQYHDTEWGHPSDDDTLLFEHVCLEGFQAGLSWITVLRKRENFRAAFANFDLEKMADFTEQHVDRLVLDAGIIRHRKKIESAINNARRALEMRAEFGSLAAFFWQYEPDASERPKNFDYATLSQITQTPMSAKLSKDLKKRGWSFVGPTGMYAFMQAVGLVNDHLEGCVYRQDCLDARAAFKPPL